MDKYLWLIILVIIIVALAIFLPSRRTANKDEASTKRSYDYLRKDSVMTEAEASLFRRLERIATDRYYVFPQVHLSSLLDEKVKGQSWKGALSAIQRKSVDFVLVDKESLKTAYAVELDDSTHDQPDRVERDGKVEQYFLNAGIPLVRLRGVNSMSDEDIENAFRSINAQDK